MQFIYGMLTMTAIYIVSGMVRDWMEAKNLGLQRQVNRLIEENHKLQDQILRMKYGGPHQLTGNRCAQLTQQYQTNHNRIARYFPK